MNKNGTTIYLKVSVNELAGRIMKNSSDRPLIKGKNKDQVIDFINSLLKEREPFYNMAHYIIENDNIKRDEVIQILKTPKNIVYK